MVFHLEDGDALVDCSGMRLVMMDEDRDADDEGKGSITSKSSSIAIEMLLVEEDRLSVLPIRPESSFKSSLMTKLLDGVVSEISGTKADVDASNKATFRVK